jgi:hypothetical protein
MEKEVWRGLATRDVVGAEDPAVESRKEIRHLERKTDPLMGAAAGDAGRG